jgi:hypothetical protein
LAGITLGGVIVTACCEAIQLAVHFPFELLDPSFRLHRNLARCLCLAEHAGRILSQACTSVTVTSSISGGQHLLPLCWKTLASSQLHGTFGLCDNRGTGYASQASSSIVIFVVSLYRFFWTERVKTRTSHAPSQNRSLGRVINGRRCIRDIVQTCRGSTTRREGVAEGWCT